MAYLDRDYDVFISYAHDDDGPARWVTHFAQHLKQELKRQLRIKEHFKAVDTTVWQDHKLPQQGNLSERLQSVVEESSIFLVIMSQSYLLSDWCTQEGVMFVNSLNDRSDLRIFIVEIEETDKGEWPEFLQTETGEPLLYIPFYEEANVGGIETIPMKTPQGSADPRADRIMKKLCDTLSSQLHRFKHLDCCVLDGKR